MIFRGAIYLVNRGANSLSFSRLGLCYYIVGKFLEVAQGDGQCKPGHSFLQKFG